jgi:thiamine transport system ATP-binding protein
MLDASFTARIDGFTLSAQFVLEKSGVIAVIGPSGAGKSSLLNAIAGYSKITDGHISWKGTPIHMKEASSRPIATLFQDNNLFPHLTIQRNLALAVTQWPWLSSKHKLIVQKTLNSIGLSGFEDRLPSKLSGGERSRAALARVLLQDRPILLLDEPFSALGPGLKDEMLDLVSQIANERNLLVMIVTHDPKDAVRVSKQTLTVIDGKVEGPVSTNRALNKKSGPLSEYLKKNP